MLAARELITTGNNVAFNRFARLETGYISRRLYKWRNSIPEMFYQN